jgi:hypothetical protein
MKKFFLLLVILIQVFSLKSQVPLIKKNKKWILVDSVTKNVISSKEYDYMSTFKEGFAVVTINNKNGYINKNGREVAPLIFDGLLPFNNGIGIIRKDFENNESKYGLINNSGKVIVEPKFQYLSEFTGDIAFFQNDERFYGIINNQGKIIVPAKYEEVGEWGVRFSDGLCKVKYDGKWGYVNVNGYEIIPCKYLADVSNFSQGIAAVMIGDKFGFINKLGQIVIEPKFDSAYFNEKSFGVAVVKKNEMWSVINSKGVTIFGPISPLSGLNIYTTETPFIKVKSGKKIEFLISTNGKKIIGDISYIGEFNDGLIPVKINNYYCFFNVFGEKVLSTKFVGINHRNNGEGFKEEVEGFQEGLCIVYDSTGKVGAINKIGEVVIPFKNGSIETFQNGYAMKWYEGEGFYIDKFGREFKE